MLAGTVMCLGIDVWRRTGSRTALLAACAAAGFGLWVQQFILYYWIALALAVLHSLPQRQRMLRLLVEGRDLPGWLRGLTAFVAVVAVAVRGLGAVAFVTGGFDAAPFGTIIGVHHAQKLWNIAAALLCVAGDRTRLSRSRDNTRPAPLVHAAAIGFAAGYAPAIVAYAAYGGSPPIARADLHGVTAALSPIAREVIPIVIGFRSPSTGWLGVPVWLGLALLAAVVASIVALRQRPFTPLFHYLLLTAAVLFLVSGAFIDAQSYRYLMPAYRRAFGRACARRLGRLSCAAAWRVPCCSAASCCCSASSSAHGIASSSPTIESAAMIQLSRPCKCAHRVCRLLGQLQADVPHRRADRRRPRTTASTGILYIQRVFGRSRDRRKSLIQWDFRALKTSSCRGKPVRLARVGDARARRARLFRERPDAIGEEPSSRGRLARADPAQRRGSGLRSGDRRRESPRTKCPIRNRRSRRAGARRRSARLRRPSPRSSIASRHAKASTRGWCARSSRSNPATSPTPGRPRVRWG